MSQCQNKSQLIRGNGTAGASAEASFQSGDMSWSQSFHEDKQSQDASFEEQSDSARGTEPDSSCFDTRSPSSSSASSVPPPADDLDRTLRHIGMQDFGKGLDIAARAMFPNDTASRYDRVYVLLITWKTQDPNLPVAVEICRLRSVFKDVYNYDVEEFEIPDDDSHAEMSEKTNAFVKLNKNSRDDLKIVYYAGHGRLSPTKELIWYPELERKNQKSPRVKWSGIQTSLEMAKSDVLILLDCCSSGVVHASDGDGITELICACGYDSIANGVGQYSFTHELTTELRLLSNKATFTVGELYSAVYTRMQSHMKQGVANERYPSPMHFVFAPEESFHRSISLSVLKPAIVQATVPVGEFTKPSCPQEKKVHRAASESSHTHKRRRLGNNEMTPSSSLVQAEPRKRDTEYLVRDSNLVPGLPSSIKSPLGDNVEGQMDTPGCPLKDSLHLHDAPRALFLVRFSEDIGPENLSMGLFKDWMSSCPAAVDEIRIEASYKCFSTLVFITMPLAMQAYVPRDPAIMALGAVKSSINIPVLPKKGDCQAQEASSNHPVATREIKKDETSPLDHQEHWTTKTPIWHEVKQIPPKSIASTPEAQELYALVKSGLQPSSKHSQSKLADLIRQWKQLLNDDQVHDGDFKSGHDSVYTPKMDRALTASDESVTTDPEIISRMFPLSAPRLKTIDNSWWPDESSSYYSYDSGIGPMGPMDDTWSYSDVFAGLYRPSVPEKEIAWGGADPSVPVPLYSGKHNPYQDTATIGQPKSAAYGTAKMESRETAMYTPRVSSQQATMATTSKSGTPDTHLELAGTSILDADNTARDHYLYKNVTPDADGLYHCPWENLPQSNCRHRPEKLKCNYEKFVDSHLQPYRCKLASCQDLKFSSTACLLRHEREAHGLYGHGGKPFLCTYDGCERGVPGNGFPRHWNLRDHMKRVHVNPGSRYNSRTPSPHREGLGKAPESTSEPSKVNRAGDDTKASELPKVTEQRPWVSGPGQPDLVNRYHEKHQTFEALVSKLADPTQADNMALLRNTMDCIKVMAQTTQRINATGGLPSRNDSQPSDVNGKDKAT